MASMLRLASSAGQGSVTLYGPGPHDLATSGPDSIVEGLPPG